ncbi:MAG: corrinoid protein [Planctomycetaceae bacterium]|jgi:corrinoid protein of di/trimethylamine methyltransferase|nr:corrinoid protein [Planctomycetaceae bacterium]
MPRTKQELYALLSDAVVEMDEDTSVALSNESVEAGYDAFETIDQGLAKGMERAGKLFDESEYFVPELLMCADALNAGVNILKPYIKTEEQSEKHRIVIGVIEGDTHDIGKNLVKLMLSSAGFEVIDLGRDVPPISFVENAIKENAEIIMMSSLMTTTMDGMKETIQLLNEKGVREQFKVAVGGGPVSSGFAEKIGADGYSSNANQAVKLANEWCRQIK